MKAEARYQNLDRFHVQMKRKRNFKNYIADPDQIQNYLNSNESLQQELQEQNDAAFVQKQEQDESSLH